MIVSLLPNCFNFKYLRQTFFIELTTLSFNTILCSISLEINLVKQLVKLHVAEAKSGE